MIVQEISLHCTEGSSDKVYHIQIVEDGSGYVVNFQYGRRGSGLTPGTKTDLPVSRDKAQSVFDALAKSKIKRGYVVTSSSTSTSSSAAVSPVAIAAASFKSKDTGLRPCLLNPIESASVSAEMLLRSDQWSLEEKFDGERQMVQFDASGTVMCNRDGQSVPVPDSLKLAFKKYFEYYGACILDGERMGDSFIAFDCLMHSGVDIKNLPFIERIAKIDAMPVNPSVGFSPEEPGLYVSTVAQSEQTKREIYEMLKERDAEGAVFKLKDAVYSEGRPASGGNYLKDKFWATASVVVTGHTVGKRSVAVGVFCKDGSVRDMGKVTVPADKPVPDSGEILEVRYLYAYPKGSLYQPTFLRVRKDIPKADCVEEQLKYKAA